MILLLVSLSILSVSSGYEYSNTSCACGWRNSGRNAVGSVETKRNEYPWLVSLNGCSGSIITAWHVLTAARCTYGKKPKDITISVDKEDNAKKYSIETIIQHEGLNYLTGKNDIAILVTAEQIKFNQYVGPVCMPNKKVDLAGQYVKVMGWGIFSEGGDKNSLREVDIKVLTLDACRSYWPDIQDTKICAFEKNKDFCMDDSGSPLVYLDPDTNKYTIAGVVVFGIAACGSPPDPLINSDVSAYVDWINSAISSSKPSVSVCTKQ